MEDKVISTDGIAVIGLGYVGLPLAVELARKYRVTGLDTNHLRINELSEAVDKTGEIDGEELKQTTSKFSCDPSVLAGCDIFIVTVPTPVDEHKTPDLAPLKAASKTIGQFLKPGAIIIYESTVYPGATEEVCIPLLETYSGLKCNVDFGVGYSPERINPGDKSKKITEIKKITSGSNAKTAKRIDDLYRSIIKAGTHAASSIRVAEAAKVIENTQRDVNIALINELAVVFHMLGIDTGDVLEAARTKWNFLPFTPGLVGGHCIGVDPYYLTHKAQQIGFNPEMILAGRRINDRMGQYAANRVIKEMVRRKLDFKRAKVLVCGLTFKENCPDIRNTRVLDLVEELSEHGLETHVYDPWADAKTVKDELGLVMIDVPQQNHYDAVIVAVAHDEFTGKGCEPLIKAGKAHCVIFDLKHILPRNGNILRL